MPYNEKVVPTKNVFGCANFIELIAAVLLHNPTFAATDQLETFALASAVLYVVVFE